VGASREEILEATAVALSPEWRHGRLACTYFVFKVLEELENQKKTKIKPAKDPDNKMRKE